jgi:Big-like domain-containing protein
MKRAETTETTERTERCCRATLSVLSVVSVVSALASCARMEPPPGGPPDTAPPQLVATRPDSMAKLPGFKGNVEFRFDEVVSEGATPSQGAGTGDLEKLIILSPSTRVPDVSWRRDRITVRPSEGWRPNRVYRVELLPGITDLRRNQSKRGTVLTFTTGAELPTTTITGTVVDWKSSRPTPAALVEALLLPDSLPYRGLADSSGQFALGPLPAGTYLVRGVIDENRNNVADPREPFDTVRLTRGKTAAGELWTFVHDTTPPRIQEIAAADSVSATVTMSQTLDPRQRLRPEAATVRVLPDSTPVRVTSVLPKPEDDSLHRPAVPAKDSLADTTRKARPGIVEVPPARARGARPPARAELEPLTSRPPLTDKLVVRVEKPWTPGGKYEVEIRGVRNTSGVAGDVRGGFTVAKPSAADSTKLRGPKPGAADSTKLRGAKRGVPDSTAKPGGKPTPERKP